MMKRKQEILYLFVYVAIFWCKGLFAAENYKIQNCLTSNIAGIESIKHCQNHTPASRVNGQVINGSICTIKCKDSSHLVNVSCVNGIWTDRCTQHANTQIVLRKKRSFFHSFRCFFWSDWKCRKEPDTSPPELYGCNNVDVKAIRLKLYQYVSWKLPTVHDKDDPYFMLRFSTIHTSPRPPGSIYFEGITEASHYVMDRKGNLGKCNFKINVKVIKCEPVKPVTGGYIQCFPVNSRIYGTKCSISCYKGYNLTGPSNFECNEYGYWSVNPIPSCQRVKCDKLITTTTQTEVTCTDHNNYGSMCTFSCEKGYGVPQNQSKVLYCKSTGKWSSAKPICRDVFPPSWLNCPAVTYIQYADRNKDTATLESPEPEVKDNVDGIITAHLMSGPRKGETVKIGSHVSIYNATDRAGNKADQCHVKTIVRQITCPKLFNKPYTNIVCQNGNRYGASCEYECADGSILKGPSAVICEKNEGQPYGFWSWGNTEPYCEIIETCGLKLNPPANGALACDYWFGGKFCQMQCRKGYNVDPGYRLYQMFVCSEQGRWNPSTKVPDCTKVASVSTATTPVSIYYFFEGDCNNADIQLEIKENFINAFKTSFYSQACEAFLDKCQVENVQVLCGKQLRRRSVNVMELKFELKLISDEPLTQSILTDFSNQFTIIANDTEDLQLNLNGSTKLIPSEIKQKSPQLHCPRGFVPSYKTISCVECQKGTFYDIDTKTCIVCPKGKYQNESSAEVCIQCPIETTTEFVGSTKIDDCKDACSPGYWSNNGIIPCIPCDRGTYQSQKGSTECSKCGGGKTTYFAGAKNEMDCQEFDIEFLDKNSEEDISITFSHAEIVRHFKLSMWIKFANISETSQVLQIDDGNTKVGIIYYSTKFYLLASCIEMELISVLQSWNFISLTTNGEQITFKVNNQQKIINESCINIPTNSKLFIGSNFTGKISQLNIWSEYTPDTEISALGESCKENKPGNLLSWKQFENMDTFSTRYIDVPSKCDDSNDCLNATCKFGRCVDMLNDYICVCDYGFTGTDCDQNIDDCVSNICDNNASCVDNIGSYNCLCKNGYKGNYCEIPIVNGSWTEWNEWSQCSKSCGLGHRSRVRLCNNPPSLNGGRDCQGISTQIEDCVIEACKSCISWHAPENASLLCVNETDENSINCTLTCDDGFEFDSPPRNYYYCGPSTFFLWEFQTDDNPANRVPSCNAVKNASQMIITYTIVYDDLICKDEQINQLVNSEIQRLWNLTKHNVKCILEKVCHLDKLQPRNCNHDIRKREINEIPFELQAKMFCDPNQYGPDICENSLVDAVEIFSTLSADGAFNIATNGFNYEVNANSSSVSTDITCPEGNEKVSYYCVECGKGKYFDGTGCEKCGFGQYQSEQGKVTCSKCPKNYTTLGRGSVSVNECFDNIPPVFDGSCPGNITEFIDINSISTVVSWTDPVPVDNSGEQPVIRLVSGTSSGSSFGTNTSTLVQFIATDKSGNNSTCKFYVHIKVQATDVQIRQQEYSDTVYYAIIGSAITLSVLVITIVIVNIVLKRRYGNK